MADKTFVAKNEIHITVKPGVAAKGNTPAKPPEVTVIPAKGKFTIDDKSDTLAELLSMNACEPAEEDKTKAPTKVSTAKKPAAKKAPAKKAEPASEDDGDGSDMV